MPTYITQGRYTREAIKGMIVKPEDRADGRRAAVVEGGRTIDRLLSDFRRIRFHGDR